MNNILLSLTFFISLSLLSGCSVKNRILLDKNQSPECIHNTGHQNMYNGNYINAIKNFQSLNYQYPFDRHTESSNVDLIYTHYKNDEFSMALTLANQFISTYPNSHQLAYVFYMLGVIDFNNGRNFFQRYLPYKMSQHDFQSCIRAFYNLKHAFILNSKSHFAEDAMRRMVYINNIIGKYQYLIAEFYFIRKAYVASINRAKIAMENYPQSTSTENTLLLMIKSYNRLKMPELAKRLAMVLRANYPENDYLKSMEYTVLFNVSSG